MNIRITALSFLVAATCGLFVNQAAKADDDGEKHIPSMRFEFEPNTYRMDSVRHGRRAPEVAPAYSVQSGSAPRGLLSIDPSFVSKVATLPAMRPAAQAQVSSRISSSNPFASIFNRPSTPLIAQGATPLAPVAWSPLKVAHAPSHHTTSLAGRPIGLKSHQAHTPSAKSAGSAPIATYTAGKFYSQGDVTPGYSSHGGSVVDTNVSASLFHRKK